MKSIGWKVMRFDPTNGTAISGADSRQNFQVIQDTTIQMPHPGVWMSLDREYVMTYYRCHDHEVLLELEFDTTELCAGNLTDAQTEFAVLQAKIVNFEILIDD